MKTPYVPNLSELRDKVNPFVAAESFVVRINKLPARYTKTGRKVDDVELESQPYTKLFRTPGIRKTIAKLSPASLALLFWIMLDIHKTDDFIWINRKRFRKENAIGSDKTVTRAIKNLIDKGFIAPTTIQSTFWINPAVFFCGSRAHKYPDKARE